jgi:putative endonuclease
MSTQQQRLGDRGETLAAQHIQAQGYTIEATNWHCSHGEIDIIARRDNVLVFIEVKTRRASTTESAFASINARKQEKLIAAVHQYLNDHRHENIIWRIDAIAIALPPDNQQPVIDHVEDALGW